MIVVAVCCLYNRCFSTNKLNSTNSVVRIYVVNELVLDEYSTVCCYKRSNVCRRSVVAQTCDCNCDSCGVDYHVGE